MKQEQNLLPPYLPPRDRTETDLSRSDIERLDLNRYTKLKTLDLSNSAIKKLPNLPECTNLKMLNLSGCEKLTEIVNVPNSIERIDLAFTAIEESPDLSKCTNLEILNLYGCKKLTKIGNLPNNIIELDLSYSAIEESPYLSNCPNLETLNLYGCKKLTNIGNLPNSITTIDLSYSAIEKLPALSECTNLKILKLFNCENLTEIVNVPNSITTIDLSYSAIEELPDLSKCTNLEILDLYGCKKLTNIGNLPNSIERLILSYSAIEELPDLFNYTNLEILKLLGCKNLAEIVNLPNSIKGLYLSDSPIKELPDIFGCTNLEILKLLGCKNLAEIVNVPNSITTIDLSYSAIEKLPALSECTNLEILNLSNSAIKELPDLSNCPKLNSLNISGCKNLPNTLENVNKLLALEKMHKENSEFRIFWPKHFTRDLRALEIKNYIINGYKLFYHLDTLTEAECMSDKAKYPIMHLFHRFMTENTESRGGVEKVIDSIVAIAQVIEKNPSSIPDIHENLEGTDYLKECVNRPVMAMIDVGAAIAITLESTIKNKIEAGKTMMAIKIIETFVQTSGVAAGLEVELFNAMLATIHRRLLDDGIIENPWLGAPRDEKDIAYVGCVAHLLTEENIGELYKKTQELMKASTDKDLLSTFKTLCSQKPGFWNKQILGIPAIDKANKAIKKVEKEAIEEEERYMNIEGYTKEQIEEVYAKAKEKTDEIKLELHNEVIEKVKLDLGLELKNEPSVNPKPTSSQLLDYNKEVKGI